MERKELCIISDSDIPSGSGGINGEGYTYGQLRHQPIITEILKRITHPIARQMAEECNERNSRDGFTMYKVDGEYCFEGLRVGPKVKIPSKEELLALLGDQPVNAATIRNITYTLLREELARLYGTSVQEAADIIGNQLDCAPHEDISGYIFMVPNWAHKWFRHNGYVSKMGISDKKRPILGLFLSYKPNLIFQTSRPLFFNIEKDSHLYIFPLQVTSNPNESTANLCC